MSSAARDAAIAELAKLVHGDWIESPQWSAERAAYEPKIAAVVDRLITAAAEEADARRADARLEQGEATASIVELGEAVKEAATACEQIAVAYGKLNDQVGRLLEIAKLQSFGRFDEAEKIIGELEVERG